MNTILGRAALIALISFGLSVSSCTALEEPTASPATAPTSQPSAFQDLLNHSVLFNGWGLSPAGKHVKAGSMPYKMLLSPDGKRIVATSAGATPGLTVVDPVTLEQTQFIGLPRAFNGICFTADGKHLLATGGNSDTLHVFDYVDGKLTLAKSISVGGGPETTKNAAGETLVVDFLSGLALHPESGEVYLCAEGKNEVWVIGLSDLLAADPAEHKSIIKTRLRVGERPYACVFGADKRHLYVSNWGDRNITVIDTKTSAIAATVTVGVRPNDLTVAPDGRLFVACAGENTVHVIQTRSLIASPAETGPTAPPDESALEVISTSLYPQSPEGSTPVSVSVSPDGKLLFVANCDNNDVAVIDISDPKLAKVAGFVPTGWYPTAVLALKDRIAVGVGKGMASRESVPPRLERTSVVGGTRFDYMPRMLEGAVSLVDITDTAELARYTEQVRKNSPYTPQTLRRPAKAPQDNPVPARVGGESPIKHVVYVIKENRTYDQVFGDFVDAKGNSAGNGDPSLTLFGEKITPNQHQLARDYVLLDNFYSNGEVSADGHSWCDAAIATDANQKGWVTSYTQHGRLPLGKDLTTPTGGYLWDLCQRNGLPFKCYGEGANQVPNSNRGSWSNGRDTDRVRAFIKDLDDAEKTGEFPSFMILSLGENHTRGTTPGEHTPIACVANNDQAVGMLVEAISKSRFWNETAIFIVEDDSQNGPDHVDSHRTCALVVSPWVKRGVVDSTPYTQVSMIRTMELILGLPPLTQYDAGATPMYNCFQPKSQSVAYANVPAKVDVDAINAPDAVGAAESEEMDFDEFDEAPEDGLNRILWAAVKGTNVPYPTPVRRAIFGTNESELIAAE